MELLLGGDLKTAVRGLLAQLLVLGLPVAVVGQKLNGHVQVIVPQEGQGAQHGRVVAVDPENRGNPHHHGNPQPGGFYDVFQDALVVCAGQFPVLFRVDVLEIHENQVHFP